MDRKKHRHVFMMRIEHRPGDEEHEEKYTAYYRKFFYDPDSHSAYLDFDDWCLPDKEDPFKVADNYYLFSPFSYQDPFTGEEIIQDHTHTKPYPMPSEKEYDPDEGIKLCAEINLAAYEKALNAWNHYKNLNRIPPVSSRATGIINYYERVVADCRQWYSENCPEFLPKQISASTDASAKLPDKSLKDTEWLRADKWPELRDRLYKESRIPLNILRDAANKIPGGKPPSLGDKTLYSSFIGYVNRKIEETDGPGSMRTAKVDWNEGAIILSRKRKNKK